MPPRVDEMPSTANWILRFSLAPAPRLGQVRLEQALVGDRSVGGGASEIERSCAHVEVDLAGEGVVLRVQIDDVGGDVDRVVAFGEAAQQSADRLELVLSGGNVARHS